jgi:hypothetical protein
VATGTSNMRTPAAKPTRGGTTRPSWSDSPPARPSEIGKHLATACSCVHQLLRYRNDPSVGKPRSDQLVRESRRPLPERAPSLG